MKKITVDVKHKQYDIILERGCIQHLSHYFDTSMKFFILTDQNIPDQWIQLVKQQCPNSTIHRVHGGEESKSIVTYEECLKAMLQFHMGRNDILIALGGGVIGDLGGFVAASYMRGIRFISIPTTTLSQIDSSIGGKVAVNLGEVKNIVGAFYHPEIVLIDFDTLTTLPHRHVINGLIEALKAGLIHDEKLFSLFEKGKWQDNLEEIIYRSLQMKKRVVEQDETEQSLRKTLNFGHTIGHGIEAYYHLDQYYHGECVAMGMLYFIDDSEVKKRVLAIYEKMGILPSVPLDIDQVYALTTMDKKAQGNRITVVKVKHPGESYLETIEKEEIKTILKRGAL